MQVSSRIGLLILCCSFCANAAAAANANDYAWCAAYYFMRSHAGGMQSYEVHYRAAETALNIATKMSSPQAAQAGVEKAAQQMMVELKRNWANLETINEKYADPCSELLHPTSTP